MKCPVCKDVTLLMTEKKGIEIDYCPECRGIWLDRGELEKLIENEEKTYCVNHKDLIDDYEYKKSKRSDNTKKRKKESFLSEVFEMFGD